MATSGFTDLHRLYLQAAISKRLMTEATAQDLYSRVCTVTEEPYDRENFSDFITQLNEGLNSVELEFRRAQDEVTGVPVIALTNTNGQKIAQVATRYSPTELEYFKHLLDAIIMADDEAFCISSTAALHEAGKLKNKENKAVALTKKDAEALLDRFVADQWFIQSTAGAYSLSMRSLLELQTFLKETYDDQIQECTLCMEIITKGQRCTVAACSSRLHQHCASAYFKNMARPVCPTCHSAWDGKILIGLSDRTAAPSTVWKRRKAKGTGINGNGAGGSADAAEEEDEEDDDN
ncbi:non-structural maintenance of chromosomes element 1 [Entomortierella parvispora]|uniref:Non-structural maintenance of chromosomes element 1 homolog n=1 Tax=Entomortierella parvispora TaxID=205924 RepID=A0A9P3HLL0_9FUNG|nr:non-structural maintenance of chromosomes element 1 [Entomortierella parvispora]